MPSEIEDIRLAVARAGSEVKAARALGMSRSTLRRRLEAAGDKAPCRQVAKSPAPSAPAIAAAEPPTPAERRELLRLRAEVANLRRSQGEEDGAAMLAEAIAEARGVLAAEAVPEPAWLVHAGERDSDGPGIPTLLVTDWHIGETVRSAEVYGRNEFNAAVSDERIRLLAERAITIAEHSAPAGGHKGGVVFLGGDFVSGWLHEELSRSDWASPLQSAAWCVSRLVWLLRRLRDAWGRLYVVGVPGNHGRLTHRPPGKGHAFQSFDWLIYTMVAQQLEGDRGITISVPDDGEQIVEVAGTRYHLMHGHQLGVKGGDGIIGSIGPIMRGSVKAGAANRSVGRDADILVLGHFHTTLWLPRAIVGGTLKGWDEYARVSRFTYEPASQLLWFTHPRWGANCPARVFLQDPPRRTAAASFVALEPAF